MTDKQLAACPLCGCHGITMTSVVSNPMWHSIKCDDCPFGANFYSSTRDEAIAAWNRRAAFAAPTEGARDASAQQDEREAPLLLKPCPFCGEAKALRLRKHLHDDRYGVTCDKCDSESGWWGAVMAAEIAWNRRAAVLVQADAAVGTAVAWRMFDGEGDYTYREDEPSRGDVEWIEKYGRKYQALYAHPDPLLAECVAALEYALPYLQAMIPNSRNGVNADCSTDVNCVARVVNALAKVQAAKEGKS